MAEQIYQVDCVCGNSFVTVDPRLRWCLKCRQTGRSKGRRVPWISSRRAAKVNAVGSHTLDEWLTVLRNQGWCCYYCHREMTPLTWTRDHVIALKNGGSDFISNIVAACRGCNCRKGTMTASAFKEYLYSYIHIQQQQKEANISVDKTIHRYENKIEDELSDLWKATSEAVEPAWVDVKYRQLG